MTTDLLFIELGAVVTQVLGSTLCTVEAFSNQPPTYDPKKGFTVDFTKSLEHFLISQPVGDAPGGAWYDQIVCPMPGRRVAIGPSFPGGGYEGILCVRDGVVSDSGVLAPAATAQGVPSWRYQVIASIAADKTIRRYHGFKAEVVSKGNSIIFNIEGHNDPITYNPGDLDFYTGSVLFNENILTNGAGAGSQGVVFMNVDVFLNTITWMDDELPKLPPSAGL